MALLYRGGDVITPFNGQNEDYEQIGLVRIFLINYKQKGWQLCQPLRKDSYE